jgi:hypothetical protein
MTRSLTPARRARLEKLAAYLESLPEDYGGFEMRHYFLGPRLEEIHYARENGGVTACGAVACAVGHGPSAGIPVPPRFVGPVCVDWNGYAGLFVGDWNSAAFDWCFGSSWARIDNHHWGAAARIRLLLKLGRPPKEMDWDDNLWLAHSDLLSLYAPYRIDSKAKEGVSS